PGGTEPPGSSPGARCGSGSGFGSVTAASSWAGAPPGLSRQARRRDRWNERGRWNDQDRWDDTAAPPRRVRPQLWWRVRDSNPRRQCQLIYSQPPLATRVTRRAVTPPLTEQGADGRIATPGTGPRSAEVPRHQPDADRGRTGPARRAQEDTWQPSRRSTSSASSTGRRWTTR